MAKKDNPRPMVPSFWTVLVDAGFRFGQEAVRYGAWVGIAYYSHASIKELAGKGTFADISVKATVDGLNPATTGSPSTPLIMGIMAGGTGLLFGIGGMVYAWYQRQLRLQVVEALGNRNKALEERVDPKRSSSRLDRKGLTTRGDR